MVVLRRDTFDGGIWSTVAKDYAATPERFDPADVVVDVGCHTGAFCHLAAERGAGTVQGYEANRENFALAKVNLAGNQRVRLHHAAVWRSDDEPGPLRFVPHPRPENTGGGSVMSTWWDRPEPGDEEPHLSEHDVETVPLDAVLAPHEHVRLLKLDAEGAEFPILLTSRLLARVETIVGEYHEFTDEQMANLPAAAVVGERRYSLALLRETLAGSSFAVESRDVDERRGLFAATRF